MNGIHRSQRSFSESFFHVLNWWYFLYQRRPLHAPNKLFSGSSKTVLMDSSTKRKCNSLRWINRAQRSFSESFLHVLNWWYFLYQCRPQCDPKYPFSGSSKTVLMDCSRKNKCNPVRWIHISPRSFQKASFLFSSEDISFVTVSFNALRSIPLQISRKLC